MWFSTGRKLAHGREGVAHPGGTRSIDLPVEKAVGLQLTSRRVRVVTALPSRRAAAPEALYPVEGHIPQDQDFHFPLSTACRRLMEGSGPASGVWNLLSAIAFLLS